MMIKKILNMTCLFVFFLSTSCGVETWLVTPASVAARAPMDKFIHQLGLESLAAESNGADWPSGFAFDDLTGDYYISYRSNGNLGGLNVSGMDYGMLKLNSSGEIVWKKLYNDIGTNSTGNETPDAINFPFHQGFIYTSFQVSGDYLETNGGGGSDIVIQKVRASDGDVVWRKQLGQTTMAALAADPGFYAGANSSSGETVGDIFLINNKLYLVGSTGSPFSEVSGGGDAFILVMDLDGNIENLKQFGPNTYASEMLPWFVGTPLNGSTASSESQIRAAIGKDGHIMIAGTTTSHLFDDRGGASDVFYMKVNPSTLAIETGIQLGVNTIATLPITYPSRDSSGDELGTSLAVDTDNGDVYGMMRTNGSLADNLNGVRDVAFVKLGPNLELKLVKQFGTSYTTELASGGHEQYVGHLGFLGGTIYVAGISNSNISGTKIDASWDIYFLKMDRNFNVTLKKQFDQGTTLWPLNSASGHEWFYSFHVRDDGILFNLGTESNYVETLVGAEDILFVNTDLNGNL